MPVYSKDNCNNVQSKLNRGGLCKSCFKDKIDLYNNPVKQMEVLDKSLNSSYCTTTDGNESTEREILLIF